MSYKKRATVLTSGSTEYTVCRNFVYSCCNSSFYQNCHKRKHLVIKYERQQKVKGLGIPGASSVVEWVKLLPVTMATCNLWAPFPASTTLLLIQLSFKSSGKSSRIRFKYLGLCYPWGRPGWSYWPSPDCCSHLGSEPAKWNVSLSSFLSL